MKTGAKSQWGQEPWVQWGGRVRGGWGWGLEVWSHGARSQAWAVGQGACGVGVGVGGGGGAGAINRRDGEWDQEPWVHEKHGGVSEALHNEADSKGSEALGEEADNDGSSLTPPPLRLGSADKRFCVFVSRAHPKGPCSDPPRLLHQAHPRRDLRCRAAPSPGCRAVPGPRPPLTSAAFAYCLLSYLLRLNLLKECFLGLSHLLSTLMPDAIFTEPEGSLAAAPPGQELSLVRTIRNVAIKSQCVFVEVGEYAETPADKIQRRQQFAQSPSPSQEDTDVEQDVSPSWSSEFSNFTSTCLSHLVDAKKRSPIGVFSP